MSNALYFLLLTAVAAEFDTADCPKTVAETWKMDNFIDGETCRVHIGGYAAMSPFYKVFTWILIILSIVAIGLWIKGGCKTTTDKDGNTVAAFEGGNSEALLDDKYRRV